MDAIKTILDDMEPEEAAARLADVARELYTLLDEEQQRRFITRMLGEPGTDKTIAMVHL